MPVAATAARAAVPWKLFGSLTGSGPEAVVSANARAPRRTPSPFRIGSIAAYPRSLGKCDRSVRGRRGPHQRGRPERYACEALPSTVAAGNVFHGYLENHIMPIDAQPSGRANPWGPGKRCGNLSSSAARNVCRVGLLLGFRLRSSRDRVEIANQSDHTSRQLGDPGGGGALLGAQLRLHAQ